MKIKIVSILVCMLLIETLILPVSGKMMVSTTYNNHRNEFSSENYLTYNSSNYFLYNGLDDFINNEMSDNHIPGLSATIVKNDIVLWTNSYGYANISQNLLVEDTTLFMLASISKTITATALMQLYDDGEFDLYDPINDYLPFDVIHPTYPSTDMTFHMLLTHSSSIKDNWNNMLWCYGDYPMELGTYLEEYLTPSGDLYNASLNFNSWEPGTNYDYCNMAVTLIGYLVEVISGIPFDEYCEINIFEPLDMEETAWFLSDLDVNNIAVPYHWNGDEHIPYDHYGYAHYPCGQLRTSVTQLRNFLMMMMNNGEYNSIQILEESTVELMLSSQLQFRPSQGLMWYTAPIGGRTLWGHTGGDWGVRTGMFFNPDTDIGVIIFTNLFFSYNILADFIDKIFDYAETSLFEIEINGGLGVEAKITNNGEGDVVQAPYEITVTGGLLGLINKTVNGTIDIDAGATETISSGMLVGFGGIEISVKVGVKEETAEGIQLFIFTIVQ